MNTRGNRYLTTVAIIIATVVINLLNLDKIHAQNTTKVHTIIIAGFKFSPEVVMVNPGDSVTWINHDFVPHTATATDKSWDTGAIGQGESKKIVITETQTLSYYCFYHPDMTARLRLE